MAWRGVKTRPADAMCRFTSVVGNSSHRLVIRVLPSPKGEKGTPSASVSSRRRSAVWPSRDPLVCTYQGTNTREDAGGCREGEKRRRWKWQWR
ncbi:hypothetical protein ALC60_12998 [Trachymyrmex zeteki]|uniref:Uncharacterized protein n=1 Tax=Mycetomoellerius zeteki TaxID=64791 RepID=A0A151WJK1_9HYME|nr:hypothetical protein ALC60_12998 [Trachymyrmex zeteki]